jgi:hypothetical protein
VTAKLQAVVKRVRKEALATKLTPTRGSTYRPSYRQIPTKGAGYYLVWTHERRMDVPRQREPLTGSHETDDSACGRPAITQGSG